jgi:hypothetical protein
MSKAIPSYLFSRNNIWYFRKRIPKNKTNILNQTEIKLSLKATDLNVAKIKGIKLLSLITNCSKPIEISMIDKDDLAQLTRYKDPDFGEAIFDYDDPDLELEALIKYQASLQNLRDKQKIGKVDTQSFDNKSSSMTLSTAIEQYQIIKESDDTFNNDTLIANIAKLETLVEIVEDITLDSLTFEVAEKVKNTLQKLPKNRHKIKAYKNKSISQLLTTDIPATDRLSPTTVTNYLEKISSFMTWCVQREYCDKNYFSGLSKTKGKNKKHSEERFPWYDDQLKSIFSHKIYTELKFNHPDYYWHPLIALFGGQRMNEIS